MRIWNLIKRFGRWLDKKLTEAYERQIAYEKDIEENGPVCECCGTRPVCSYCNRCNDWNCNGGCIYCRPEPQREYCGECGKEKS